MIKKNNNNTLLTPSVAVFLKSKFLSWLTTICDTLNIYLGGGSALSPMVYSPKISNKLTALFNNTQCNVVIYVSKVPNAFTFPGAPTTTKHPIIVRLLNLASSNILKSIGIGFIIGMVINTIITTESLRNLIKHSKPTISVDPITKKINFTIPEITCYVSTGLIDMLSNDDETLAVLLHEVGHNSMIMLYILDTLLSIAYVNIYFMMMGLVLSTAISGQSDSSLGEFVMLLLLLCGVTYVIMAFISRRQEIKADEFAIRCGYGNELSRAIKKLHGYWYDSSSKTTAISNLNFVDRILHFVSKIAIFINNQVAKLRLGMYPDMDRRERLIDTKTEKFETVGSI